MLRILVASSLFAVVSAFMIYRGQIPNGNIVPDPCNPGSIWAGVGHWNSQGGGDRNPFGEAFALAGYRWTDELCNADSDGDGWTNGQELGDEHCHWTPTNAAHLDPPTGHPGIREPTVVGFCESRG